MDHNIEIKVMFLDEASAYLETLPQPVLKKMAHNIARVAGGEINSELFKKTQPRYMGIPGQDDGHGL